MFLLQQTNDIKLTPQQMSDVAVRNLIFIKELLQICFDVDAGVAYENAPIRIRDIGAARCAHFLVHVPDVDENTGKVWDYELEITAEIDVYASSPARSLSASASRREYDPDTGTWKKSSSLGDRKLITPMIKALDAVGIDTVLPVDHAIGSRREVAMYNQPKGQELYQPDLDIFQETSEVDVNAITL